MRKLQKKSCMVSNKFIQTLVILRVKLLFCSCHQEKFIKIVTIKFLIFFMNQHEMFLFYFFRELGVAWWIRNNNTLRKLIEKVAKASFQTTQDPLDAAIFYLAMKKKSLCWGLYRSIKDEKMATFFKNNFSEDRWRKAALKNAFALLGRVILIFL